MDWITEELASLSLGDKRLDNRAHKLLTQLSRNPTDSITVACSGAGEKRRLIDFLIIVMPVRKKFKKAIMKRRLLAWDNMMWCSRGDSNSLKKVQFAALLVLLKFGIQWAKPPPRG